MTIRIDNKEINKDAPVFIIAELSANHNHKLELAIESIRAAKKAGADAVKLQTYTPDTITIDCSNEYFKIKSGTLWDGKTLYELYQEAFTPWEWHKELQRTAKDLGLVFFSSPFDKTSVDFLEELDVPAYKIASFEITDIPLIEYTAAKGKPVIISTGIADIKDIEEAVSACKRQNNNQVILLKCTSAYPAPLKEMNLMTIPDMADRFKTIVGLSDHTVSSAAAVASVALGAKVIEKHFILDKGNGGPDAAFSIEPFQFKDMVCSIRDAEKSLGRISYELTDKITASRNFARSLFVVSDMEPGDIFNEKNVRSIRPGNGLHPKYLTEVLGKKANTVIKRGTPLKREFIS